MTSQILDLNSPVIDDEEEDVPNNITGISMPEEYRDFTSEFENNPQEESKDEMDDAEPLKLVDEYLKALTSPTSTSVLNNKPTDRTMMFPQGTTPFETYTDTNEYMHEDPEAPAKDTEEYFENLVKAITDFKKNM